MADIAVVFHWAPADMDGLTLTELTEWRAGVPQRISRRAWLGGYHRHHRRT